MFKFHDLESNLFVFTESDPKLDGYEGAVEADVTYDEDDPVFQSGEATPDQVLCVSLSNPNQYRVIRYAVDAKKAGFRVIGANAFSCWSYAQYLRRHPPKDYIPGTLQGWLQLQWEKYCADLLERSGFDDSPVHRRHVLRVFLGGNQTSRNWIAITEVVKTCHLLELFPDY